jgi:hypothetical protein
VPTAQPLESAIIYFKNLKFGTYLIFFCVLGNNLKAKWGWGDFMDVLPSTFAGSILVHPKML